MMNNAYHETVFKSLQELKNNVPTIAVFTTPHKAQHLQMMVNTLGFKVIFPSIDHKNLSALSPLIQGTVIDVACLRDDIDIQSKDFFSKKILSKNCFVNICDMAIIFDSIKTNAFKNIVKFNLPLYVLGDSVQKDKIYNLVKKNMQSLLSFRTSPMPAFLHPQLSYDIFYDQAQGSVKILGIDNVNHLLNCPSLFYAVLSSALASVTNNITIATISASIIVRAASRRALSVTNGPGSFVPVFLDSLFHLKREYLYQIQLQDKYVDKKEPLFA